MKRTFKYIIGITCSLAAVFSCARFDEQSAPGKGKMEHVVFSAVIEGGEQTKTALGGEMGDEYRQVLWQPGDSVGICSSDWWYSSLNKFVNTETEESETASLEGEIDNGSNQYYAFYPFSKDLFYYEYSRIRFVQPSVQTYGNNTFNANAMPMVARAGRNEVFQFYSLCGVLAVNLTGSETVKSISFSGSDASGNPMPVAGYFDVNMDYETYPEMVPFAYDGSVYTTVSSVTLDCGEGVTLDSANSTAFYIVLPVGTYDTFTIAIATTDGKLMLKKGTNPLNIRRANVTKAGSLVFVEDVAFDLSEHGTANSYIVTEPGLYSIKADVIGNGGYGIIDGAGFHTDNPFITPKSAKLIWEDRAGVLTNVTPGENTVNFLANGQEGNALIGVTDDNGTILWSWHIWVTDQPQEQTYITDDGEYVMLDRNLGAVRSDRGEGEEWKNAIGLAYQWGRKDPFTRKLGNDGYYYSDLYTTSSNRVSISEALNNPTVFYGHGYSDWTNSSNPDFWDSSQKTIYDPCPVGYVVPSNNVWAKFAKNGTYGSTHDGMNVEGSYDNGLYFIYDGVNTTYYPINFAISQDAYFEDTNYNDCKLWSSSEAYDNKASAFKYNYDSYVSSWLNAGQAEHYRTFAMGIRCMKDNGYVDAAKPLVKIVGTKNITAEAATLEALVADEGSTPVVERGIIWGMTNNLDLENGTVETDAEDGIGSYSVHIDGLVPATKYFYRAYAKNAEYTSYSETKYFYTPYEGNVFNLSQEGTANCYIVPPACAEYAFNASVKGNSKESVGQIASAEVLWETTLKTIDEKVELISDVVLNGDNIHFTLSPDVREGNAVIAVLDADGTILWSWHIWIVDFEPEDTQVKNSSGAVMMDRNLGATRVVPLSHTTDRTDYTEFGLYYQWGRKDPVVLNALTTPRGALKIYDNLYTEIHNNIEWTYNHPTEFYDDIGWNNLETLWGAVKTINDPCPYGWKVPDSYVWNGWDYITVDSGDCYIYVTAPYSESPTYYPLAGYGDYTSTETNVLNYGYYWTTTPNYHGYPASGGSFYMNSIIDVSNKASVRCMKEPDPTSADNEGYTGSEYEW